MPTYEWQDRFGIDLSKLGLAEREAFNVAVRQFVEDLELRRVPQGLRVKVVQGAEGVWEMTWADDGRATFF